MISELLKQRIVESWRVSNLAQRENVRCSPEAYYASIREFLVMSIALNECPHCTEIAKQFLLELTEDHDCFIRFVHGLATQSELN